MPSIFRNIFSRGENRPAQQAQQAAPAAARPAEARIPAPQPAPQVVQAAPALPSPPPQDFTEVVRIGLTNLRVGNEPDANLITIPSRRGRDLFEIAPPQDADTDPLTGYDYVEHLANSDYVFPRTKRLLSNLDLTRNGTLEGDELTDFIHKMKMIGSQCKASVDFRNSIESLSDEALSQCGDRRNYYFEQIFVKALLHRLSSNRTMNEVDLFNLGVAYFKLDVVHEETQKYLNEDNGRYPNQSVHDFLNVEYFLQERLGLPTRHRAPRYRNTGNISAGVAARIGDRVEATLCAGDGVRLIAKMSTWEPWAQFVQNTSPHKEDFEKLTRHFQDELVDFETGRSTPGHALHNLNEQEAIEAMDTIGRHQRNQERELVGQKAREFLLNNRASYLIQRGQTPAFFNQNW